MKKLLILGVLVVLAAVTAMVVAPAQQASADSLIKPEHLSCTADSDCVLVQTQGCSCLCASDDFQPVNKSYAAEHKQPENCSPADLKTCSTNGMCGRATPVCEAGQCVVPQRR